MLMLSEHPLSQVADYIRFWWLDYCPIDALMSSFL